MKKNDVFILTAGLLGTLFSGLAVQNTRANDNEILGTLFCSAMVEMEPGNDASTCFTEPLLTEVPTHSEEQIPVVDRSFLKADFQASCEKPVEFEGEIYLDSFLYYMSSPPTIDQEKPMLMTRLSYRKLSKLSEPEVIISGSSVSGAEPPSALVVHMNKQEKTDKLKNIGVVCSFMPGPAKAISRADMKASLRKAAFRSLQMPQ